MEDAGTVAGQLACFIQEQRETNGALAANIQALRELGQKQDVHNQEIKDLHDSLDRRWTRMFKTHEGWLKNHEVRLKILWRQLRG